MTTKTGAPQESQGERRSVYSGKVFEVFHLDRVLRTGKAVIFEHAERSPGVRIIVTDGDGVMLTKEYRDELGGWDYRLPGGKVFDPFSDYAAERHDRAAIERACLEAAARELSEEARIDIEASDLRAVHIAIAGATIVWDLHYFVAKVARPIPASDPSESHEGELVGRAWVSRAEAVELFKAGAMREERSAAVLMRLILAGDAGFGAPPRLAWERPDAP